MDAYTIRQKIDNKEYAAKAAYPTIRKFSQGHIFDEDKSVKWNREEVERHNTEVAKQMEAYRKAVIQGENTFKEDVIAYLLDTYSINKAMAEKIFAKAYDDGHSGGMHEVLNIAIDLVDFVVDIMKLSK